MIPQGLDKFMRPMASPIARPSSHVSQVNQMNHFQYNPLGEPNTTAKGTFVLYDKTGGTALFKYDPTTGAITILGSFIANQVNTGTYSNIVFSGTNTLTGTISQGVLNTNLFQAGTINNSVIGTPNITGGSINPSVYLSGAGTGTTTTLQYIKTVSPGTILGTLTFTNGLLTLSQ